jgi:hypothetical protein
MQSTTGCTSVKIETRGERVILEGGGSDGRSGEMERSGCMAPEAYRRPSFEENRKSCPVLSAIPLKVLPLGKASALCRNGSRGENLGSCGQLRG